MIDKATAPDPDNSSIMASYMRSKYLSIKWSSYFQVYDSVLEKYRGTPVTFVEIGVLNGGSLFMWRDYLGDSARIIGIDLNPTAKKWESHGFEIFLGNQSDPAFWNDFFAVVGPVDVLVDDGGHTNEQQVVTAACSLPWVNDGGMLIVEDTHTSYLTEFGNPSSYSFMNYAKALIDDINKRSPELSPRKESLGGVLYSVAFYESIVAFSVNRKKSFRSTPTSNNGETSHAEDFRHGQTVLTHLIRLNETLLAQPWFAKYFSFVKAAKKALSRMIFGADQRFRSLKLRRYFR